MAEAKRSLHSEQRGTTSALLAITLAIAGVLTIYSHTGLAAKTYTNTEAGCRQARRLQTGVCDAADLSQYVALGEVYPPSGGAMSPYERMLNDCNTNCGLAVLTDGTCVFDCLAGGGMDGNWSFSSACTACAAEGSYCGSISCTLVCYYDLLGEACRQCTFDNCNEPFLACTGFPEPAFLNEPAFVNVTANRSATPASAWYDAGSDVYLIQSLVDQLEHLADKGEVGGVLVVMTLLIWTCVWPYALCVLLGIGYFAPLMPRTRGILLRWTGRHSRYGLLIVFNLLLLCSGLDVDYIGGLKVLIEARAALVTFTAAMLLLIGAAAAVLACHLKTTQTANTHRADAAETFDPAHFGCFCCPLQPCVDAAIQRHAKARAPLLASSLLALALSAAAVVSSPAVTWSFGAIGGDKPVSFADLGHAAANPQNADAAGAVFLSLAYYFVIAVVPLLAALLMALSAIISAISPDATAIANLARMLNAFNCLDVLMYSAFIAVGGMESVVESNSAWLSDCSDPIRSDPIRSSTGESTELSGSGAGGVGLYLLVGAVVSTYVPQALLAVRGAQGSALTLEPDTVILGHVLGSTPKVTSGMSTATSTSISTSISTSSASTRSASLA